MGERRIGYSEGGGFGKTNDVMKMRQEVVLRYARVLCEEGADEGVQAWSGFRVVPFHRGVFRFDKVVAFLLEADNVLGGGLSSGSGSDTAPPIEPKR